MTPTRSRVPACALLRVMLGLLFCRIASTQGRTDPIVSAALPWASTQLAATSAAAIPSGAYPNNTGASGEWLTTGPTVWTAGFLSGCYWRMYHLTQKPKWARLAMAELPGLAEAQYDDKTSNGAGIIQSSYLEALEGAAPAALLARYRRVVLQSAASLAERYNPKVGCFRSWGSKTDTKEFKVIIDSMAGLPLMWKAAAMPGGKAAWAKMARSHARRTATQHFRSDSSTYHVVIYNPRTGAVKSKVTHQGYSDDSTWARGQAWAVLGFAQAAELSGGDPLLLATARRAADWFVDHLPSDKVPRWDFDAPSTQPWKDTSAAAIAADGLLRLARVTGQRSYRTAGKAILRSLAENYLSDGSGLRLASILRNGTANAPKGQYEMGLIYGDFHFLDALSQL